MHEPGVTDEKEFTDWLKEEEAYLKGLQSEPLEETLEMEYPNEPHLDNPGMPLREGRGMLWRVRSEAPQDEETIIIDDP
ncbi:hypothetical protein IW262DRAFT_1335283 [Armillaria fumosa]|nr:hypothetical protein IW262DRAFT_1335283 [Armillaria fumosa]